MEQRVNSTENMTVGTVCEAIGRRQLHPAIRDGHYLITKRELQQLKREQQRLSRAAMHSSSTYFPSPHTGL